MILGRFFSEDSDSVLVSIGVPPLFARRDFDMYISDDTETEIEEEVDRHV